MAGHILCIFFICMSTACPCSQSHVLSSTWNKNFWINWIFQIHAQKLLCGRNFFDNSIFGIATRALIPKLKMSCQQKRFSLQKQKMHHKTSLFFSPLVPLCSQKNIFSFSFFQQDFYSIEWILAKGMSDFLSNLNWFNFDTKFFVLIKGHGLWQQHWHWHVSRASHCNGGMLFPVGAVTRALHVARVLHILKMVRVLPVAALLIVTVARALLGNGVDGAPFYNIIISAPHYNHGKGVPHGDGIDGTPHGDGINSTCTDPMPLIQLPCHWDSVSISSICSKHWCGLLMFMMPVSLIVLARCL